MATSKAAELSNYLKARSREICADSGCKRGEDHRCESYAYIDGNLNLLDICVSDFFQGSSKPHAAVSLPWTGCGRDLKREVEDQCADME